MMTSGLRLAVLAFLGAAAAFADSSVSVVSSADNVSVPKNLPGWVATCLVKDNVDAQVSKLDGIVHLDSAQRLAAAEIFAQRLQDLNTVGPSGNPAARSAYEKATNAIEALLTADQRRVYNATPMESGGQSPFPPTVDRVGYLDAGLKLSPEQMTQAAAIFEDEVTTVAALPIEDRTQAVSPIGRATLVRIKGILTEAQAMRLAMGSDMIDRQLPLRILISEAVQNSRSIATLLGPVTAVKPKGMRGSWAPNGRFTEATFRYEVTGSKATELLTFRLVADDQGRPTLSKVTDPQGTEISL